MNHERSFNLVSYFMTNKNADIAKNIFYSMKSAGGNRIHFYLRIGDNQFVPIKFDMDNIISRGAGKFDEKTKTSVAPPKCEPNTNWATAYGGYTLTASLGAIGSKNALDNLLFIRRIIPLCARVFFDDYFTYGRGHLDGSVYDYVGDITLSASIRRSIATDLAEATNLLNAATDPSEKALLQLEVDQLASLNEIILTSNVMANPPVQDPATGQSVNVGKCERCITRNGTMYSTSPVISGIELQKFGGVMAGWMKKCVWSEISKSRSDTLTKSGKTYKEQNRSQRYVVARLAVSDYRGSPKVGAPVAVEPFQNIVSKIGHVHVPAKLWPKIEARMRAENWPTVCSHTKTHGLSKMPIFMIYYGEYQANFECIAEMYFGVQNAIRLNINDGMVKKVYAAESVDTSSKYAGFVDNDGDDDAAAMEKYDSQPSQPMPDYSQPQSQTSTTTTIIVDTHSQPPQSQGFHPQAAQPQMNFQAPPGFSLPPPQQGFAAPQQQMQQGFGQPSFSPQPGYA